MKPATTCIPIPRWKRSSQAAMPSGGRTQRQTGPAVAIKEHGSGTAAG